MATLTEVAKKQKRTHGKSHKSVSRHRKPVAGNRKPTTSVAVRVMHPYADIAKAYNDGLSWNEIADKFKIKRSSMNGISDRMAVGIIVNGKTIKIDRGGKRSAAKKSAAA